MHHESLYHKLILPSEREAMPGRDVPILRAATHAVKKVSLLPPFRAGTAQVQFGMGCFWGAERLFWGLPGVEVTAVGYAGGFTPHPTYEEVCSGMTGHTEVVLVVFDPAELAFDKLLQHFWENHNPTQGARQANDIGTQYRSAIYVADERQWTLAQQSLAMYQVALWQKNLGGITTELRKNQAFYYAEEYHQQYLAKNPGGYCNLQSIQKTRLPAFPAA